MLVLYACTVCMNISNSQTTQTQTALPSRCPADVYACSAGCRSEHFQEFFHAAKGTSQALNDNKSSTADALSAGNAQHAHRESDPDTASPSTQDFPASMAQTTLETVPQAQDSGPVQTGASPPDDDDPQTLRQLQHEQAAHSGPADLQVRFADVGCGFGGLLVRLSPMYPDKLMVGMEIRDKVSCSAAAASAAVAGLWTVAPAAASLVACQHCLALLCHHNAILPGVFH